MLQLPFWFTFEPRLVIELVYALMLFHQDSHPYIHVTILPLGLRLSVKCKGHEANNVFRCETHSHKWGSVQGMKPNDSQVHSHFGTCIHVGVANVWNLGWKNKQTPNWAQEIIREILKHICLHCPCIVHLDLICMNYDQRKGRESNWEFDPDHNSLENKGQMRCDWNMLYIVGKIFLKATRYLSLIFKKNLIWERYEYPMFWKKSSSFGTPTWKSQGKVTFGCNPHRKALNIL
jgi:hypothetical protein